MDLKLTKNCSLTVSLRHSVRFMVIKHTKVWKRRYDQQDYLGFYTLDSHHLSPSVHGLLGKTSEQYLMYFICFVYVSRYIKSQNETKLESTE